MDLEIPVDSPSDTAALQQAMVDQLKAAGCIRSPSVEAAFRAVPRHLFLPGVPLDQVYRNEAIATKFEGERPISSSSQPSAMTAMLEQLGLEPGQHILEVGAGTGYNAAIMARITGETGKVTAIDIDEDIVEGARQHLTEAGFGRVEVVCGDGGYGYANSAPYDRIILTVGAADISPAWREQLKPDGRMVIPLAILPKGRQLTFAFEFSDESLISVSATTCAFMPLRGAFPGMYVSEDRKVELGPDPGLLLHLNNDHPREVAPEMIYGLLTGPGKDLRTGIRVTSHELEGRFFLWLALREPEQGYRGLGCSLRAEKELADRGIVPYLFGLAGKICATGGLLRGESMAVYMRQPGQKPPSEWPKGEPPFELFVRSYGLDASLAEYLIDQVRNWDAAGRPPDPGKLRVRAYPIEANYTAEPDEIVIDRRHTRFVVDW